MVMERVLRRLVPLALAALMVTLVVTLVVPGRVGVPEMMPVAASNDKPAGSVPETLKLVGLLVAMIW